MNKTARLKEHNEKLIYLNSVHHYTQTGHPKIQKYFKLLLQIKNDIFKVNNYKPYTRTFEPTLNQLDQLKTLKK
jgi:hypothetical protein